MAQESAINPNGYVGARSSRYFGDTQFPGATSGPTDAQGNVQPFGSAPAPQPQSPLARVQGQKPPGLLTQFAQAGVPFAGEKIGSAIGGRVAAGQDIGTATENTASATARPVTDFASNVAGDFGAGPSSGASNLASAGDAFGGAPAAGDQAAADSIASSGEASATGAPADSFAGGFGGAAGAGVGTAAIDLATGAKPKVAVGSGIGSGIGFALGSATPLGPVGGFIGGAIGGIIGGAIGGKSVVCTELLRQNRMPRRFYVASMRAFERYPAIGIPGYHLWATPCARHLRRHPGSLRSGLLDAVFNARAEHIAWRSGVKAARPRPLGAVANWIMWPVSYALGVGLHVKHSARFAGWRRFGVRP